MLIRCIVPQKFGLSATFVLFIFADIKLILLKLTRIEQQQQHQARMLQSVLEVLQATEKDSGEMPSDVNLPLTTVAALKAIENKLESEEFYKQMVTVLA